MLQHDRRDAGAGTRERLTRVAARRAQVARIEREHAKARASGDRRRELELNERARRVEREIAAEQRPTANVVDRGALAGRVSPGGSHAVGGLEQAGSFLDRQAALAPSIAGTAARRDYAALAALIGYRRAEYERLAPARQQLARTEIDRELALRDELPRISDELGRVGSGEAPGRRELREAERALQGAVQRRMSARGQELPLSRAPWLDAWSRRGRISASARRDSPVMRDAREILRRRKRQLGTDEP